MHRCYIKQENWTPEKIRPPKSEGHHLLHVLRAEEGDRVEVFDGDGLVAEATVHINSESELELLIQKTRTAERHPFEITLITAIPKGSRADIIFEKATELGTARIQPVISERVIVRLKGKQADTKVERWRRIAESAAKQCGTKWLPQIESIRPLNKVLTEIGQFDAVLIGSLVEGVRPLKEVITHLHDKRIKSLAVIIGPEGDLTSAETQSAIEAGAIPVTFGELTLRAETAAIYALSVLSYEFLWQ